MGLNLVLSLDDALAFGICNVFGTRPIATKQDKLQDSSSLPISCSFIGFLAGAHDFKYPVHSVTMYFLSGLTCFLRRCELDVASDDCFGFICALHFIRQKNDRRPPGQKRYKL